MNCMHPMRFMQSGLNDKIAPTLTRLFNGVTRWNEELSTPLKHDIENKWQNFVYPEKSKENDQKPKYYVLSMFPYPSGRLHMGHVRVYTISDTMARFHRLNGKNVIHPMGWDAFGLPAENAAIERGIQPRDWTDKNIRQMKEQLQKLGCSFDWDRELRTCDPKYYKWTQFLFLKLFESGLVYQKEALVNWDPVDQTVLADEQVDENGCSWRSGAKVEKKILKQWFIRTTHFSKSLVDGLNDPLLENWRDIIKVQKNWIGDCNGTNIDFEIKSTSDESEECNNMLSVWTQNPELVFAARFIAVAPNSVLDILHKEGGGDRSNRLYRKLPVRALNSFTGEYLPIFVTDQVEYEECADTHLGIPDISETDRQFAIAASIPIPSTPEEEGQLFRSEEAVKVARDKVCEIAKQHGRGGYPTSSKLRDWLISRQRYWGTPIPIVHCTKCGPQPVPKEQLPILLPELQSVFTKGSSPLSDASTWYHTPCPKCGEDAKRETDTMDTFVDSSWYFLRYLDPHNTDLPFSKVKAFSEMPVDLYIGGKEHAVLHLYYARFFCHFLHSQGLVPYREPFRKLLVQGMVMGQTFKVKRTGRYLPESAVEKKGKKQFVEKATGEPVETGWEKMSKSKYNGVDPENMFKDYGIDTTRLLILANVAPTSQRNWTPSTFPGILKWQHRLWLTMQSFLKTRSQLDPAATFKVPDTQEFEDEEAKLFDSRNYYIKGVTFNYSVSYQLSVAISKMQGLTSSLRRAPPDVIGQGLQFERALACLIVMLSPMAPHFASELWAGFVSAPHRINTLSGEIKWDKDVLEQVWPEVDSNYCLELLCRVNGLEQGSIKLPKYELNSLTHDDALELALSNADTQQLTAGRKIVATNFTLHHSYEAIIDIMTERAHEEKTREAQDG